MPPSKEATLARVRNNQRRSRARRQEYIASLERKLQEYEAMSPAIVVRDEEAMSRMECENKSPKSTSMAQLEVENKRLKSLLEAAGLPGLWMNAYLRLQDEGNSERIESPPARNDGLEMSRDLEDVAEVVLSHVRTDSAKSRDRSARCRMSRLQTHRESMTT
jgi:hypothetical protein